MVSSFHFRQAVLARIDAQREERILQARGAALPVATSFGLGHKCACGRAIRPDKNNQKQTACWTCRKDAERRAERAASRRAQRIREATECQECKQPKFRSMGGAVCGRCRLRQGRLTRGAANRQGVNGRTNE